MKIPVRCNKRACQARRNLSKRPEFYRYWPKCHLAGCGGLMYVDKYRLRKGPHDHPPTCSLDCYPYPHSVGSPHCRGREDLLIERSLKLKSKHSPVPLGEPCIFF